MGEIGCSGDNVDEIILVSFVPKASSLSIGEGFARSWIVVFLVVLSNISKYDISSGIASGIP